MRWDKEGSLSNTQGLPCDLLWTKKIFADVHMLGKDLEVRFTWLLQGTLNPVTSVFIRHTQRRRERTGGGTRPQERLEPQELEKVESSLPCSLRTEGSPTHTLIWLLASKTVGEESFCCFKPPGSDNLSQQPHKPT